MKKPVIINRVSSILAIIGGLIMIYSSTLPLFYRVSYYIQTAYYGISFKIIIFATAAAAVCLGVITLGKNTIIKMEDLDRDKTGEKFQDIIEPGNERSIYLIDGKKPISDRYFTFKHWLLYKKRVINNLQFVYLWLGIITAVPLLKDVEILWNRAFGISTVMDGGFSINLIGGVFLLFAALLVNRESVKELKGIVIVTVIIFCGFILYFLEFPDYITGKNRRIANALQMQAVLRAEQKDSMMKANFRILNGPNLKKMGPAELLKEGTHSFNHGRYETASFILDALIHFYPDSPEAIEARLLLPKAELLREDRTGQAKKGPVNPLPE